MPSRFTHGTVIVLGSIVVFIISVWHIWFNAPSTVESIEFSPLVLGSNNIEERFLITPPVVFPYKITQQEPKVKAMAATVFDVSSNMFLYKKNAFDSVPVASLTKVLTALVSVQEYPLEKEIVVPQSVYSIDGSKMHLLAGDTVSVRELLAGLLIPSGNDAAYTLAYTHPQGYDAFITYMNQYARQKGLTATYVNNPVGYDFNNHVSSAHDLSLLSKELLEIPELAHIVDVQKESVFGAQREYILRNTNTMLSVDARVTGIKTGTSEVAGENIIISWKENDRMLIAVILNSHDRYNDAITLMNWVTASFVW